MPQISPYFSPGKPTSRGSTPVNNQPQRRVTLGIPVQTSQEVDNKLQAVK